MKEIKEGMKEEEIEKEIRRKRRTERRKEEEYRNKEGRGRQEIGGGGSLCFVMDKYGSFSAHALSTLCIIRIP